MIHNTESHNPPDRCGVNPLGIRYVFVCKQRELYCRVLKKIFVTVELSPIAGYFHILQNGYFLSMANRDSRPRDGTTIRNANSTQP